MGNTYPTPGPAPVSSAYRFLQNNNRQNVDIRCQPGEDIRAIHHPPRPTTESLDQVRSSLAKWEAGQNLGTDYFNAKEGMMGKIDAITACLALEPQVDGFVQSANASPTNFGKGAGGEPMSLDTLNSIDDYGYSLRNYITADLADDSNFLQRVSVGKVSTLPVFVGEIPPPSGLGTGATGEELDRGGGLEEGYEGSGWEVAAGAASCG